MDFAQMLVNKQNPKGAWKKTENVSEVDVQK